MDKITKLSQTPRKESWGGGDTKRRGCYLIKKTGMVKFVKIEKIRIYEAADAKKKITWQVIFGKQVLENLL